MSPLAATLGYGKASLSKILATLVREGFVRQVRPGEDGRGGRATVRGTP